MSSTSAARRRRATSAPRRRCWRSSRRCTRSTTGPTACGRSRERVHAHAAGGSPSCSRERRRRGRARHLLRHGPHGRPRQGPRGRRRRWPRHGVNLWAPDDDHVQIACDERTTTRPPAADRPGVRGRGHDDRSTSDEDGAYAFGFVGVGAPSGRVDERPRCPTGLRRTSAYLQHPVFHLHRSETAMLRYLRRLSDKDLALDRTMIPLGSCTMKLNATAEMEPISWPEFATIHPYAPTDQTAGLRGAGHGAAGLAGGDHRATPRCRCSRTRGRRASWPGCSPSTATTRRAARSGTSA